MAFGPNVRDAFRQVGVMTGKVLQGTKPAIYRSSDRPNSIC